MELYELNLMKGMGMLASKTLKERNVVSTGCVSGFLWDVVTYKLVSMREAHVNTVYQSRIDGISVDKARNSIDGVLESGRHTGVKG